jgi:Protein of unknown function (DUF2442)
VGASGRCPWTASRPQLLQTFWRGPKLVQCRRCCGSKMKLNNTPPPDVTTVQITDERLTFGLEDGRAISVPLSFYPTLQLATRRERADFEISHTSVYWPKLDCDISSDCLLRGAKEARKFAERAWRKKAKLAAA